MVKAEQAIWNTDKFLYQVHMKTNKTSIQLQNNVFINTKSRQICHFSDFCLNYKIPTVKFNDFSLTFQVLLWQFPWLYQNNNPIAQMLLMVHYTH